MDRLEDPRPPVAETRRRRQPEPAGHRGGEVGEDVPEHVLGDDDVELLGGAGELHGGVVDEHVLDLHVRVVGRDVADDAAPEPRRLEHVRLVDRRQLPAARAGELEASACEPFDLARVVLARVEDGAVVADAAGAEVEAADELAHDHEIDRAVLRGPQVRVHVELGAEPEHALLGPDVSRVELGMADRRLQHRVRRATGLERLGGSESPVCLIASAPNRWSASSTSGVSTPRTRCATAITSGPMQSPGRQTTRGGMARD